MIIGYYLTAQDNGAYFFNKPPEGVLCPECGTCLDCAWHPDKLWFTEKIVKKDASYTYDGRLIVSKKFKKFCEDQKYEGIHFYKVYDKPVFYYMVPENILPFDSNRRMTRFIGKCKICGGYESVVGATPVFLRRTSEVGDGIFRSDLVFASGKEKSPLILVGSETRKKLKNAKLTGVEFKKIDS